MQLSRAASRAALRHGGVRGSWLPPRAACGLQSLGAARAHCNGFVRRAGSATVASTDGGGSCSGTQGAAGSPAATMHRVATYNVLSDSLADPGYFKSCDPAHLAGPARLERVKAQLVNEIAVGAVVCLQEVSYNWAGALHAFLSAQGYYMITANYGRRFNGYMGTAICFPAHRYTLVRSSMARVADGLDWTPREPLPKATLGGPEDLGPVQSLQNMGMVERKDNVQLSVHLRDASADGGDAAGGGGGGGCGPDEFCVSTYHMPCAFRFPHVMTCHAALSVHTAATFAGEGTPFVLAGDFNFDPRSDSYALVTSGKPSAEQLGHMRVRRQEGEAASWVSNLDSSDKTEGIFEFHPRLAPLASAYQLANGAEPEATNYAKIQDEAPFIECLDYIFLSPGDWNVNDTRPLRSRAELVAASASLPSEVEPSDHVLIGATLSLQR